MDLYRKLIIAAMMLFCYAGNGQNTIQTIKLSVLIRDPKPLKDHAIEVRGFFAIMRQPSHAPICALYVDSRDMNNDIFTKNEILVIPDPEMLQDDGLHQS